MKSKSNSLVYASSINPSQSSSVTHPSSISSPIIPSNPLMDIPNLLETTSTNSVANNFGQDTSIGITLTTTKMTTAAAVTSVSSLANAQIPTNLDFYSILNTINTKSTIRNIPTCAVTSILSTSSICTTSANVVIPKEDPFSVISRLTGLSNLVKK